MNILIIGGGVAAFEAATAAASFQEHRVTVCSREAVLPYRRPALSRMVMEELSDTAFYFKNSAFFQEKNITVLLNKEAVAIDLRQHKVAFKDGSTLAYDRLILATGGDAFTPPLPGAEYAFTLRNFEDLQKIRGKIAEGAAKAVVIGGGVLGLELADSLLGRNCSVTLIETGPTVLSRNLDQESAEKVMEHLAALLNLSIRTQTEVKRITPESVELENEIISSDLTVFSAGVRCCTKLAENAGLPARRGIIVDQKMQTSDPDIFSCGDAAEPPCGVCTLLSAAKSMGHTAGINAGGGDEIFVPEVYPVRLMALGLKLFSAGKINDAFTETSCSGENYQRLIRDSQGNLTGAILLGDLKAAVKLQKELVL